MTQTARCCCGRCSLQIEGDPVVNGVCHCDNCKRRTGSAFGWSIYVPDDRVTNLQGEFKQYILDEADPQRAQRWFCAHCGTTLYWKASAIPGHTGIAAGCIADPAPGEPVLTASDDHRLAWLVLPDNWARMA